MKDMSGFSVFIPRMTGWLGLIHPPSEEDKGAKLRFLDPTFANSVDVGDTLYVKAGDTDGDNNLSLSAPMHLIGFNRELGEVTVDPPLLSVVPDFLSRSPQYMRLMLPDAYFPMSTLEVSRSAIEECAAVLTERLDTLLALARAGRSSTWDRMQMVEVGKFRQVKNTAEAINSLPKTTIVVAAATDERPVTHQTLDRTHMHIPPDHFAAVLTADNQWEALMQACEMAGVNFRALDPDNFALAVD